MAIVLGVNAVFHDPAAALVVDGTIVAAAEEERFSRRKHGKSCVPFSTWEQPGQAARWCLESAGIAADDVDAIGYSYDVDLCAPHEGPLSDQDYEPLRTWFARRAPSFIASSVPGLRAERVRRVAHHVAHAASAHLASGFDESAVIVLDGRGESTSALVGHACGGDLTVLATQPLPHSLGLLYEELTVHLGFHRSSDEYKVMALASYGDRERFADQLRRSVRSDGDGGFVVEPVDFEAMAPAVAPGGVLEPIHADLASAVQMRLEEIELELARWAHEQTGARALTMAGGVALNCVANARLAAEGPFDQLWVQPAAGDAGTALGAALAVAHQIGDRCSPMTTAALGRSWSEAEIEATLTAAGVAFERPNDFAGAVAEAMAHGAVIGWFEGRSEFGPRALGHRSLLVDPRVPINTARMNAIKGREEFRPVAPMVLLERAAEIFDGVLPSPYMLFVHHVRNEWRDRIPAAVHVDGTARAQTVDRSAEPLMAAVLDAFCERTGVPVCINTSFNTAGRPIVDSPRDALECFGSGPIDLLAMAPFIVRRSGFTR